ncbi:unnamed protein product [Meganyctiphanes norvegica]|uniref:Uncharacterized protein n=1 Tax=Meganyctiphanes norvegica TaxID=48144 RepID=A0AAV2QGL8_MEGNR
MLTATWTAMVEMTSVDHTTPASQKSSRMVPVVWFEVDQDTMKTGHVTNSRTTCTVLVHPITATTTCAKTASLPPHHTQPQPPPPPPRHLQKSPDSSVIPAVVTLIHNSPSMIRTVPTTTMPIMLKDVMIAHPVTHMLILMAVYHEVPPMKLD